MREPGDRREAILDTAAALFARKGVAATTVRQIADEVGILSGSLYHHFDSKEAMVDEIISSFLRDLKDRYAKVLAQEADARIRLHDLIVASLEVVEAHPHAAEIYQNDVNYLLGIERFGYLRNAGRQVQDTWLKVIEAGVAEGVFRGDLDAKILYRLMRDAVWLSVRWFKPSKGYPIAKLAEDATSLFLDGLTAKGD
ncbi:TetR/AcrR family transcriptional regulator [Micromonospora sp. NPDC050200]|uniref:TetR/AcrR family transcriptional regulator n=1 Tax=Micromonospora sp. NPDC050200 TaxID=3155664 RepID=UPI0033DD4736